MGNDTSAIDRLRDRFEQQLMNIDGVVLVSTSIDDDGAPCLLIGTSVPVDEVRGKLPKALTGANLILRYVGDISAQ
jgi:hypothetical protein